MSASVWAAAGDPDHSAAEAVDVDDLETVVRQQLPALLRYAAALTGDRELAADVVQEVLVRAHSRWRRIGLLERPDLYLRRMVTNEVTSWRRRWHVRTVRPASDEVLTALGLEDSPLLKIAKELEQAALTDSYFVERKLYPNVDFYSGIIYKALGIPTEMFTVMFALGRLPGWIAQWKEMRENKEPIGRPRQIYVGEKERDYVAIADRK